MQLDVKGLNGDGEEIGVFENLHAKQPDVMMVGTEVPHTYQTRGVYRTTTHWRRIDFPAPWERAGWKLGDIKGLEKKVFPIANLSPTEVFLEETTMQYYKDFKFHDIENPKPWMKHLYYQSSYDNATVRQSARKSWQRVLEFPYLMGQFRWTAFDYLGESNVWPSRFANFGIIDLCGFPKDHYYLYQSLWTEQPMVHLLPHWTHTGKEGTAIPMVVYTNCDSVKLELNDTNLGTQTYKGEQLVWQIPYQSGEIKVTGFVKGKAVTQESVKMAGKAAKIHVKTTEKKIAADGKDVLLCEITITDANGVPVPLSDNLLEFKIKGSAKVVGADNGDPLDLTDYASLKRRAFRSKCLVALQSTKQKGKINLEISAEGLETASCEFEAY